MRNRPTEERPGIPSVDPLARRGITHAFLEPLMRHRAVRWLGIHAIAPIDPYVRRITGGRLHLGFTLPTANLTTLGAKSGSPRTVSIVYFFDGPDVILIASSFGRDRHPAWYHNLRAHPEATIERGKRSGRYRAEEVLDEAEHDRLFALAERVTGAFTTYKVRTQAIGRQIPVMRLTPID
jgi:deazaflavin-dependent oxidoreductase (nitroreductase family)